MASGKKGHLESSEKRRGECLHNNGGLLRVIAYRYRSLARTLTSPRAHVSEQREGRPLLRRLKTVVSYSSL